ncbi:hypothetical protein EDD16DRAFT_1793989 [Pisolithus croceorrhizus]|nr:hypothetical protein EDD16DRAFT_1793989 [Pisolithus croceorrhizus]
MSTGVSYVNLPFGGGVMRLSTGDSEKDTFDYQDLEFEVLDPVPVYQQEELLKVVDDVLESPESKSALRKAVQDLGDSAYSIEICFNNVADGLRSAQVQGTQAQKKHLQGYVDNWAVHHKGYVQLLWESRRVAGHARVIANDFAGEFLSWMEATDITLIEKKAEISAYRKQLDEDAKKSSDLSQRFDGLRRAVEDFQSDVTGFLKTGRALEAQLQETVREVAEIKQRISQFVFLCNSSWLDVIGIGAWSARIGLAAYRQRKEKQGKLAELKERQMHFEEQTRGLEGMHKIHAILDPLKSDIELIKEKLAVFGQIWQLIHADLNAVEKDLELATTSAGVALFKRRLRRASKAYALLADALYQYETNVHIQRVGNL